MDKTIKANTSDTTAPTLTKNDIVSDKASWDKKAFLNLSYEEFVALYQTGIGCECAQKKDGADCELMKAFQALNGKWRLVVIYQLSKQATFRFGELRKAIPGITNTMLTTTLRELEENGIIARKQFNEIPPHVEYSLTDKGRDLFPIFFEMIKWSAKYL